MNGFATLCSLAGGSPSGVTFDRMRKRRGALAAMMRNRSSVRYLVAPHGYGKSVLAYDYADSICSLERSWWVDAGDPRFLRDLDDGRVPGDLLKAADRSARLVVFDDVPFFGPDRAEAFSKACCELVDRGWEIVVTALPSCDRSKALGCEVTLLASEDLALDDDEACEVLALESPRLVRKGSVIPVLAWGSSEARRRFASKVVSEGIPRDMAMAIMALFLLQRGSLPGAVALCGFNSDTVFRELASVHTYLGIDVRSGSFDSCAFDPEELSFAFGSRLSESLPQGASGIDVWGAKVADLLLSSGRPERACDVVRAFCSQEARCRWLAQRQRSLAFSGCCLPARRLEASLDSRCCDVLAWGAWRKAVLRDEGAYAEAKQALFDPDVSDHDRMLACLLLLDAPSQSDSKKAAEILPKVARFDKGPRKDALSCCARRCQRAARSFEAGDIGREEFELAKVSWLSAVRSDLGKGSARSLSRALSQAEEALSFGAKGTGELAAVMLVAAFRALVRMKATSSLSGQALRVEAALSRSATAVLLSFGQNADEVGYPIAALVRDSGLSEEVLCEAGVSPRVLAKASRLLRSVQGQREEWRRLCDSEAASGDPAEFPSVRPSCGGVPELRVDLLGGVVVRIGSRKVEPKALRRQSVRTLLALLILAQGRELSVERVERTLWPDSTPECARNNFYSSWSHLRRALTLDSGECPYLVRLQHSCRMESAYVSSDVGELAAFCARVGEGRFDAASVGEMVRRAEDLHRGELLPGESRNPIVIRHRAEIRSRHVDALVSLSGRMLKDHEPALALDIARKAVMRDSSREDVYEVLMQAQAAMGQRTGAMASFMECRRMLNEDLGIDPSSRLSSLYESLLGEDDGDFGQMRLPI